MFLYNKPSALSAAKQVSQVKPWRSTCTCRIHILQERDTYVSTSRKISVQEITTFLSRVWNLLDMSYRRIYAGTLGRVSQTRRECQTAYSNISCFNGFVPTHRVNATQCIQSLCAPCLWMTRDCSVREENISVRLKPGPR